MPYPGIQNDEALFGVPIFANVEHSLRMRAFHHDVPLMVMTYVGALKSWVYWVLFRVWKPSLASVRWPVLLTCAATVWLSGRLLLRAAGRTAAVAAAALLATDATFLLTSVFDWGPVAFQRLFAVAAMLLALRFHERRSRVALFGAFL